MKAKFSSRDMGVELLSIRLLGMSSRHIFGIDVASIVFKLLFDYLIVHRLSNSFSYSYTPLLISRVQRLVLAVV